LKAAYLKSWHQQITIIPSDPTKENPASPARPAVGKDQSQELPGSSTQKKEHPARRGLASAKLSVGATWLLNTEPENLSA
jgi:hypothetical protein